MYSSMRPGDPKLVENLFNDVAPKYDRLNDLLSLGLHRVWKKQLLDWLRPVAGEDWIDLCCGTGDLSLALARRVRPEGTVLGLDSAIQPLSFAMARAAKEPMHSISWLRKDALDTGLPSCQFDGAVMAYGLRNLSDPLAGLAEMRRLLKPGARAGILDFNHLSNSSLRGGFQKFYLRKLVVPIAAQFGLRHQYAYLEESLKNFPDGLTQETLAKEAGFEEASHRTLAAGQMGVLLLLA